MVKIDCRRHEVSWIKWMWAGLDWRSMLDAGCVTTGNQISAPRRPFTTGRLRKMTYSTAKGHGPICQPQQWHWKIFLIFNANAVDTYLYPRREVRFVFPVVSSQVESRARTKKPGNFSNFSFRRLISWLYLASLREIYCIHRCLFIFGDGNSNFGNLSLLSK